MTKREQLYADLPSELKEADELLHRFGRWAMDRFRPQRCASAEGAYRPPPGDVDREPREVLMPAADVAIVNRALQRVPTDCRLALMWIYVPTREPLPARVRRLRVPASLLRDRHLSGVRMFWNIYRVELSKAATRRCSSVDISWIDTQNART